VLGLERYDIPHTMGSSHGEPDIRLAYSENPSYVPRLRRSYQLFRELESAARDRLLATTGGIDAAPRSTRASRGRLESCREHGLAHEVLSGTQINARFLEYNPPPTHMTVFSPTAVVCSRRDASWLMSPEPCTEPWSTGGRG
jgi:sarcosine oxidase